MSETSNTGGYVGVDVSKPRLDVGLWPSGEVFFEAHDEDGIVRLVERLTALQPKLVVLESTGRLEVPLALALDEQGVPYRIVNPRHVREFARAMGKLAKTDRIDALILARWAVSAELRPKPLPEPRCRELKALVLRRLQLVRNLVAEKNRLGGETVARVKKSLKASIQWHERQIAQLDRELERTVKSDPLFNQEAERLASMPGVGKITVCMILSCLPELGALNRQQLAALVGVAPFNDDSGHRQGKRFCWGGRAELRSALYMAALTAIRHNPIIKNLYLRLRAVGKQAKVALVACMRKILTILNAMTRDRTMWRQTAAAAE